MKNSFGRSRVLLTLAGTFLAIVLLLVSSCQFGYLFDIWYDGLTFELDISPFAVVLEKNQHVRFTALGGEGPYSFIKTGGGGTLTDNHDGTAEYAAPAFDTDASIQLRDGFGRTIDAYIRVSASPIRQLRVLPSEVSLTYSTSFSLVADGGLPPYIFRLVSGAGALTDNENGTAAYTAPATGSSSLIQVEDYSGQTARASVTLQSEALSLTIVPTVEIMEIDTKNTLIAWGGVPPYSFSSTGGTIEDNYNGTAVFTAPAATGAVTVTVTDSDESDLPIHHTASLDITVVEATVDALTIVPRSVTVSLGSTFRFDAEGGDGSYTFSMESGDGGTVTQDGLYTAPSDHQGTAKVRVTDGRGITDAATVMVLER